MLYSYTKQTKPHRKIVIPKSFTRSLAGTFLLVGLFFVFQATWPIIQSYLLVLPQYADEISSPLASYVAPIKIVQVHATEKKTYDSLRPSTWFVGATGTTLADVPSTTKYTLSIPKLKIKDAKVEIGGDDLKKSLIAWPTSAIPGSYGVDIIFGHSELPAFANSTSYSGMFTHLMDLENGDEIEVTFDGITYKYAVFDKVVIDPTNVSILEQRFDQAYLNLVTCVPPGTVWKRGVVKAKLVQ